MFLMLGLLWGTALAAIPIVVHLMHRQRTTPVEWAAMQFLMSTPVKMRRQKWIDNWLLLLVRMLIIALVALLLARPLLATGAVKAKTAMDVAVVIDHSLSTGRIVGDQMLFARGADTLVQVKQILPAGSTVTVLLAEHNPRLLTPLPLTSDAEIGRVISQLRQMRPGLTDASIPLAVQEARRQLISAGKNQKKMIVVVSDDQRSAWSPDNPTPWLAALGDRQNGQDKDLLLYAVSMQPKDAAALLSAFNITVSGLTVQPGMLALSRPSQIAFTVNNQGPAKSEPADIRIAVDGVDLPLEKAPALDAGKSQTFSLPYMFTSPGSHFVRVTALIKDALEADNSAVTAVNVVPAVKVLVIDGQPLDSGGGFPKSEFLISALQAARTAEPTLIGAADAAGADLSSYAVVVLNDVPRLPDPLVSKLVDHTQAGRGLLLILGNRTDPAWINNTLARTPLFSGNLKQKLSPQKGAGVIDIRSPQNPAIAMLTESEQNAFAGAAITSWWNATGLDSDEATILSVSADGASYPLAIEHSVGGLGGKVVTWTIASDRSSGTLPLAVNFVPFVNETIFHLASGTSRAADFQLIQGQQIAFTAPAGVTLASAKLTRPDGIEIDAPIHATLGRSHVSYADSALPGLYQLKLEPAGTSIPNPLYYGVAIDPAELESRMMTPGEFESLHQSKILTARALPEDFSKASAIFETESQGTDIARYLALAVVALIIAESLLTRRAARIQSGKNAQELLEIS